MVQAPSLPSQGGWVQSGSVSSQGPLWAKERKLNAGGAKGVFKELEASGIKNIIG